MNEFGHPLKPVSLKIRPRQSTLNELAVAVKQDDVRQYARCVLKKVLEDCGASLTTLLKYS